MSDNITETSVNLKKYGKDFIPVICKIVCEATDVPIAATSKILPMRKSRKREYVTARQLSMTFAKIFTKCSLAIIGGEIGSKDHATVLHAVKTVNGLVDTDKSFKKDFHRIMNTILRYVNDEETFICPICEGLEVGVKAWVNPNSEILIEHLDDEHKDELSSYCFNCKAHVVLIKRQHSYDGQHYLETVSDRM